VPTAPPQFDPDTGPYRRAQSGLVQARCNPNPSPMPATRGRPRRHAILIFGIATIAGCARRTPDVAPRATPASDASVARVRSIADEVVALAQEIGGVPRSNRSQFNSASLARWDASVDRWLAELRPMNLDEFAR